MGKKHKVRSHRRTPGYPHLKFPLRDPGDAKKFFWYLWLIPTFVTVLVSALLGYLIFAEISPVHYMWVILLHFAALIVFLSLLWVPAWLAILSKSEKLENSIIYMRNIIIVAFILFLFPHQIVRKFLSGEQNLRNLWPAYLIAIVSLSLLYLIFTRNNLRRTAFRDIRQALDPQARKHPDRWLWFDGISFFLVLFGVFVINLYFSATLANGKFEFQPYQIASQLQNQDGKIAYRGGQSKQLRVDYFADSKFNKIKTLRPVRLMQQQLHSRIHFSRPTFSAAIPMQGSLKEFQKNGYKPWMLTLAWLGSSIFAALIFFLFACLPNRLMNTTLISVTFHERDIKGIVQKSYRYFSHFILAMLFKHPFLLIGGILLTLLFLATPIILFTVGQFELLNALSQADEIVLALGIFFTWLSPLAFGVIYPDETFGEYFNTRLANHLMMVQGHLVFIGFGNLGKRVLDREVYQMFREEKEDRFFEVVTPDLRLESLCNHAVVIERDPKDVIYSGESSLLGAYGVVSTCQRMYPSEDPRGEIIHPESRVLVPIVIGEAKESFISSRVNLERASLIICMVPDEESVQAIFERATKSHVSSILSVSRSDQISYLTYRARHRRIVLVYPKHNQGNTLGHRLWAAILKARALVKDLPSDNWPNVLVIGNNKANYYMLETLWTYLPGGHKERTKIIRDHFGFIVTSSEDAVAHAVLKDKIIQKGFDQYWPATYITGGRYPYLIDRSAQTDDLFMKTRQINAADVLALESCLKDFRPSILVINDDDIEKSSLMLSRCVRALERLKIKYLDEFHLPLVLLSASKGDERERLILGDASRYYDALCKMHNETLAKDISYPGHARYDHYTRELIGETISDSLADSEEIIVGATRSFSTNFKQNLKGQKKKGKSKNKQKNIAEKQFVEISSCLPNRPGSLANYVASLAGILFKGLDKDQIEKFWQQAQPQNGNNAVHVPSFHYLRNINLDPAGKGFSLTGYAILRPLKDNYLILNDTREKEKLVVRVFANDGRKYIEKELDPDEVYDPEEEKEIKERLQQMSEPTPPGIPDVIDRLTNRKKNGCNSVGDFQKVMLDPQPNGQTGKYACPGMNLCRIAAYQDYVVSSNNLRLAKQANLSIYSKEKLWHAKNYSCCTNIDYPRDDEKPDVNSAFARVFCCCNGTNDPGMIALVLNALLFRSQYTRIHAVGREEDDWVINIDYFKDMSCQNSYFSLNRLFGCFEKKPNNTDCKKPLVFPLHLVRILPIGSVESAKLWYNYARALWLFLNEQNKGQRYKFYWLDENRARHGHPKAVPGFDEKNRRGIPIVLVIKREDQFSPTDNKREELCKVCRLQEKEYDCSHLRVWV